MRFHQTRISITVFDFFLSSRFHIILIYSLKAPVHTQHTLQLVPLWPFALRTQSAHSSTARLITTHRYTVPPTESMRVCREGGWAFIKYWALWNKAQIRHIHSGSNQIFNRVFRKEGHLGWKLNNDNIHLVDPPKRNRKSIIYEKN